MSSKSQWGIGAGPLDLTSTERLFFTEHEWQTIEAMTSRIYPTDHDPGAKEAGVTFFIDRYLSGTDYVFAAADGSGFLKIEGRDAAAWEERIGELRVTYRNGIAELDALATDRCKKQFKDLSEDEQDYVLELLSHAPKPVTVVLGESDPVGSFLQAWNDDGLGFFDLVVLHTRQGMFSDPFYGGNRDRAGWNAVNFPGPPSLKSTNDLSYNLLEQGAYPEFTSWEDLIPHLRSGAGLNADQ